ncbi:hypothetical protein CA983_41685 [Streptomyces swartbergensis]|uniref:Uncharacterized protein n=1 Tax=Streptomyces swartbergensis TaxID=487165 RepID=A0A243QWD6_9ACTN|nr:hypothetical protein CA983_41685 [Streptomyces swartbergensis]
MPELPSPEEIEAARTPAGGWTRNQLAAWGVPWPPPKGWKEEVTARWRAGRQPGQRLGPDLSRRNRARSTLNDGPGGICPPSQVRATAIDSRQ